MIVRKLVTLLSYKVDDSKLKQYDKQASSTIGKLGSLIGSAIKAGLALGSVVTAAFLTKLVSVNSEFDALKTRLETLEGKQGAAKTFKELEAFAASTPNKLNDIVGAYTRLKAAGFKVNKQVLTNLGDLGARSGKTFSEVVDIMLSASRGQASMVDNIAGLSAKAENGTLKLTDALGKVSGAYKGNKQDLLDFFTAAGRTEGTAGGMEKLANAIPGLYSTLQDNVDALFREVGKLGANDVIRNILANSIKWVRALKPMAQSLAPKIAEVIAEVSKTISSVFDSISENSTRIKSALILVAKAAGAALLPMFLPMLLIEDFLAALQGKNSIFGQIFGEGAVQKLVADFIKIKDSIESIWHATSIRVKPAMDKLGEAFSKLGEKIFGDMGQGSSDALDLIVDGLVKAIELTAGFIDLVVPGIIAMIEGFTWLVELLTPLWPAIAFGLKAAIGFILIVAALLVGPMVASVLLMTVVWSKFFEFAKKGFGAIRDIIKNDVEPAIDAIKRKWDSVSGVFSKGASLFGSVKSGLGFGGSSSGAASAANVQTSTTNNQGVKVGSLGVTVNAQTSNPNDVGNSAQNAVMEALGSLSQNLQGAVS